MTHKGKKLLLIAMVFTMLCLALFGQYLAPNDPYETNLAMTLHKPVVQYPFGTDQLGRCIFSRLLAGVRISVFASVTVVLIVFVIGTCIGIFAGFLGGKVDALLMRITVLVQAFPAFVLAIAIAGMIGPGLKNAILSMVLIYWTTYARLGRSLVLQVKSQNYVKAAQLCGAGKVAIIFRYILPNMIDALVVTAALDIGTVIIQLASLSFLGLGAQPPVIEWGSMINASRQYMQVAPWYVFFPSLMLFVVVVLYNKMADYLNEGLEEGKVI